MNPEDIPHLHVSLESMFSSQRIPEPSAEMRSMATEVRQLAAALHEVGFSIREVEYMVNQQVMYGLMFIRGGTYTPKRDNG